MRIAHKLPLAIASIVLVSTLVSSIAAYLTSSSQLVAASEERLFGLAEARRDQVVTLLDTIAQDGEIFAGNASIIESFKDFNAAVQALAITNPDPGVYLRKIYVDTNPNPPDKRWEFSGFMDRSEWGQAHVKFHMTFHKILESRRLSDILLVNSVGRIVYTHSKRSDLMDDLRSDANMKTVPGKFFDAIYKDPRSSPVLVSDIFHHPAAGGPVAWVAAPVFATGDEFLGVLILVVPQARLNELVNASTALGETGEAILVGSDGRRRTDSRFDGKGKSLVERFDNAAVSAGLAGRNGIVAIRDSEGRRQLAAYAPLQFKGIEWALVLQAEVDEILAPVAAMRAFMLVGGLVTLLVAGTVGIAFAGRISRPVSAITAAMNRLAAGDTSVEVPNVMSNDEIGEMTRAFTVFKTNAINVERMQAARAEADQRMQAERERDLNQMADRFEASITSVVGGVTVAAEDLKTTAGTMTDLAEEVSLKADAASQAAEHTTLNVETVAAAAEELTASVEEISRRVGQASEIAGTAVDEASRANSMVQGLSEAAGRIGEVVNLINHIAGQTNLLALNATIEAARAGEMGKGFAVVAGEVKNLANQTAKATDEIRQHITSVQDATVGAVTAIQGISGTIAQINEIAIGIADAVHNQGSATHDIARNIQEAAASTREVSDNVGGVNLAANRAHASASTVMGAVESLSSQGGKLRGGVDEFLAMVRR